MYSNLMRRARGLGNGVMQLVRWTDPITNKTITKPHEFQAWAVRKLHRWGGRGLLADDMGLGKTVEALIYAHEVPKARPALVICPAFLKFNWEREAARHVGMRAEILDGTRVPRRGILPPAPLSIINYEILGPWMEWLMAMKFKLIILDECQYVKSRKAKRTRYCRQLCWNAPRVIALSGTPLTNRPEELWSILNMIRPDLYSEFMPFAFKYCKPQHSPHGWLFPGADNLDHLHHKLKKQLMIRRKKSAVMPFLPKKVHSVIPVKITNLKEYVHAKEDFLGWLYSVSPERARTAARAEGLARLGYLLRLIGEGKRQAVSKWIEDFLGATDDKLLVFGRHVSVVTGLHNDFPKESVVIYGAVSKSERNKREHEFQNNPKIRVLIGNIQAAGVGLNLTAASYVVLFDPWWNPAVENQAIDRTHRIGQSSKVIAYRLLIKNSIEEKIRELQKKKKALMQDVLGEEKFAQGLTLEDMRFLFSD